MSYTFKTLPKEPDPRLVMITYWFICFFPSCERFGVIIEVMVVPVIFLFTESTSDGNPIWFLLFTTIAVIASEKPSSSSFYFISEVLISL